MKKAIKLLTFAVLIFSIFCISVSAAATDDAQLTYFIRDGVNYIGTHPVSWCTYYTAQNNSGEAIYSYTSGDTNLDGDTDVCDLVKINNESLDFDFDGVFAANDLGLMRVIIFNPYHTYETKIVVAQSKKMGRQLVWHDEFSNVELDTDKWSFNETMSNSNHEHVNDSKHVRVEDGNLHLQIWKSSKDGKTYSMPSGIATTNTMLFKYGYLEMRAKVPYRKGAWPSFWCTSNTPLQEAENRMEVDIMEGWSSTDGFSANLHKWSSDGTKHVAIPSGGNWPNLNYTFNNPTNLNNEYHTYGFEWDTKKMSFYVDDVKFATIDIASEKNNFGVEDIPEMDMFQDWLRVIINNECFAPGDKYASANTVLSDSDPLPIDYYIDYIRLYQNPDKGEVFKTTDEIAAIVSGK